jgi:hypothetical protein
MGWAAFVETGSFRRQVPLVVRTIGATVTERLFRGSTRDHKGDADFIGARNILTKTPAALVHVPFPRLEMSVIQQDVPDRQ